MQRSREQRSVSDDVCRMCAVRVTDSTNEMALAPWNQKRTTQLYAGQSNITRRSTRNKLLNNNMSSVLHVIITVHTTHKRDLNHPRCVVQLYDGTTHILSNMSLVERNHGS